MWSWAGTSPSDLGPLWDCHRDPILRLATAWSLADSWGAAAAGGKFCWYAASSPGGKWRSCGDKRPLFGDICVVKNHNVPQQNTLLVVEARQLLDLGTQWPGMKQEQGLMALNLVWLPHLVWPGCWASKGCVPRWVRLVPASQGWCFLLPCLAAVGTPFWIIQWRKSAGRGSSAELGS